jgi:hypothetical protein
MARYKCPKCGMEYDEPGTCEMCNVEVEEVKEEKAEEE